MHLEKDVLFEVKIHGLPAKKKRELEETLRSFATSVDGSSDTSAKIPPRDVSRHTSAPSKNTSQSSTTSRPMDSAYASMSASGPASISTLNRSVRDRNAHNPQGSKEQKIQSFLQNVPQGLLPKQPMVMTERQKKKIVVMRLENIFTGKMRYVGDHSQPLQQQEVSESAAMADRAANSKRSSAEGIREAHMLLDEMEIDKGPAKLADDSSHETNDSMGLSDSAAGSSPDTSHEQRPTRPLDLDPDRAQIPSDNVEYIRHLGLSAPTFGRGISGDVHTDDDGWMYLNLLINMAQLHIINVTPDFVRSAVAEVSDKFELSRDGRKVRWKGGTDGTRFSSDSTASSRKNGSPMDSDSLEEADRKRRKINARRFASVPVEIMDRDASSKTVQQNPFYYKPLFHHRGSSSEESTSYDESESPLGYGCESGSGRVSRVPHLRSRWSHTMSGGKARRRNDGPIIFYSGMQFCTDLSGDRGSISTPLHETAVGKDGCSNHAQDALGCISRIGAPSLSRTPSGSILPFRPFKDYSSGPENLQTMETTMRTPDLAVDENGDLEVFSQLNVGSSISTTSPINFTASGVGGTQPADHFAVRVETRRTRLNSHTQVKLSKFSAPGLKARKFLHTIPTSTLEVFKKLDRANSEDIITSGLASLNASSPPNGTHIEDLPVQIEIVSAQFFRLQPSALPPPLGYYAKLSDSDSDVPSDSSSFSGISHLPRKKSYPSRDCNNASVPTLHFLAPKDSMEKDQNSGEMQDDEEDHDDDSDGSEDAEDADDDSDDSIDMLASARQADPLAVAAREEEFEMQSNQRLEEIPAGSAAATVDGGSGCSSSGLESSIDIEMN
jgi:hypothetical protein